MRITFTGDILCYQSQDRHCRKKDGTYDYHPIYEQVKPLFVNSDYVVGSFETTCSGREAGYTNADTCFNTPDAILTALKDIGFNLLTTANNHCLDRGEAGLRRTIFKIREAGMESTGTRFTVDEEPYIIKDLGGTKVAFLAYTYGTNSASNSNMLSADNSYMVNLTRPQDMPVRRPFWKKLVLAMIPKLLLPKRKRGVVGDCVSAFEVHSGRNSEYEQRMLKTIKVVREKADIVIMCLHSGGQFNNTVGQYTRHLFDIIAEAGVDAIICNHAHTTLPIYCRGNCLIASALGNFSFAPGEGYWVDGVQADYSAVLHIEIDNKRIKSYNVDICKSSFTNDGISITHPVDLAMIEVREVNKRLSNE